MNRLQAITAHICSASENENVNENPSTTEGTETVSIKDNRTGEEITGL